MRLFQKKEGAPAKGLPRRILPLALAAAVLAAGGVSLFHFKNL